MKLRFLKFFVISFVVIFAVLNGRFLLANVSYFTSSGTLPPSDLRDVKLPISSNKTKPLPDKAILTIERLGVSAPIVFNVGSDQKQIYANLENGTVHYSNSPKPGLEGTSIVLGHSSAYPWYKGQYGAVFALLGKLNPGDRFTVQYEDGRTFTFAVKRSIVFSPLSNDARLSEIENTPGSSLVLISCWPVGTNYKRIAVQAELK